MAMTVDSTVVDGIIKRFFKVPAVQNTITAKQSAIWRDMKRDVTDGGGDYCTFTQYLDDPFTVAADDTIAIANAAEASSTLGLKYNMPWQSYYAPIRVSSKAEAQGKTDKTAWFKVTALMQAAALRAQHHTLSVTCLSFGWGELASQGIAAVSGFTFTAVNGSINHFLRNMKIVFALPTTSMHSQVLRSGTPIKISSVDYSTGIVTCATALATPGGATGDYVFLYGSRENSATPTRRTGVGLRAWLPTVRPVTDATISSIEGTSRAGDSRAYGNFVDATDLDELDGLGQCAQDCVIMGNASNLTAYVSSARFKAISEKLSGDRRFTANDDGTSGFLKITVMASEIKVSLKIDRNLEDDVGYLLEKGSFECIGMGGEVPHIDADNWVRVSDGYGKELRTEGHYAFIINDPASCGVVLFADL